MRQPPRDNDPEAPVADSIKDRARRRLLLDKDPGIESVSMQTLVGIASAIENEAVRRYEMLAELMERRGEAATAAAFRVMLEEERDHVDAVEHWAATVGEAVPPAGAYAWQLPDDLSSTWDDISGSALLTPYRAFALAVENEQRAFSFYAYLAAHADSAAIMQQAEKLGAEELRHAALMRRFRRRAWHRERRPAQIVDVQIASSSDLQEILAQGASVIARSHRELASRLRQLGDEESARLLERDLQDSNFLPRPAVQGSGSVASGEPDSEGAAQSLDSDPVHLLIDAQKPLETLSETLEAAMRTTEGELFAETTRALTDVITRLARISLQAAHRMQQQQQQQQQQQPA